MKTSHAVSCLQAAIAAVTPIMNEPPSVMTEDEIKALCTLYSAISSLRISLQQPSLLDDPEWLLPEGK